MRAKILFIFFAVLLVVNLAWVWRFDQNNVEYAQRMNDSRARLIQANRELYLMNRGWEFSVRSNDMDIPATLPVMRTGKATSELKDIIGNSRRLVLVLSDRHCSSCIDQLLFSINQQVPVLSRSRLLVLYSVQGPTREQWSHRQKILAGVEFLEIEDRALQLPLDSLDIPYFFMTGPEHRAGLTFTPYPTLEVQTRQYLATMVNRYIK